MRDLAHDFPKAQFTGFDLTTSFFPSPAPPHTAFVQQDIHSAFSAAYDAYFGLVHQRLVLLAAGPDLSAIIARLARLVSPGGYLQLGEGWMRPRAENGDGVNGFIQILGDMCELMGGDPDYWGRLPSLLEQNGFEGIQSRDFDGVWGPKARDRELSRKQTEYNRQAIVMLSGAVKGQSNRPIAVVPRLVS